MYYLDANGRAVKRLLSSGCIKKHDLKQNTQIVWQNVLFWATLTGPAEETSSLGEIRSDMKNQSMRETFLKTETFTVKAKST